jgi:hypothetical protein
MYMLCSDYVLAVFVVLRGETPTCDTMCLQLTVWLLLCMCVRTVYPTSRLPLVPPAHLLSIFFLSCKHNMCSQRSYMHWLSFYFVVVLAMFLVTLFLCMFSQCSYFYHVLFMFLLCSCPYFMLVVFLQCPYYVVLASLLLLQRGDLTNYMYNLSIILFINHECTYIFM